MRATLLFRTTMKRLAEKDCFFCVLICDGYLGVGGKRRDYIFSSLVQCDVNLLFELRLVRKCVDTTVIVKKHF